VERFVARLRESAATIVAASGAVIVAFDRHFIFNPDLPERLQRDLPLIRHDRSTWQGYIDYSTRADMVPAALQIRPKLCRAEDGAPTPIAYHAAPESDDQEPVGRVAR
jgi:hypothetical protein